MPTPPPHRAMAKPILVHPDNVEALRLATVGGAGPAQAYLAPSPAPPYQAMLVVYTARSPYSRVIYLADQEGKLWYPEPQPRVIMGISTPDLTAPNGEWKVVKEVA